MDAKGKVLYIEWVQISKPRRICSLGNVLQDPDVTNLPVTFVFQAVTK